MSSINDLDCAICAHRGCESSFSIKKSKPANCPSVTYPLILERAEAEYDKEEVGDHARQASILEFENYDFGGQLPSRRSLHTVMPRVEETVCFAKKISASRLGIAFCAGLRNEAKILSDILNSSGFQVISVACKVGAVPKERIGLKPQQKIFGANFPESMCNPIAQAELLNAKDLDLVIMVGLCVGHDTLFIKYCKTPVTVLVVKDRVFGHNPVMGLYLAQSLYYGRLLEKSPDIQNHE